MYLEFFGLDEPPFSITPDPKFVFLSKKHQESLAHLVYGISRGGGAGFVQLTGEVGTGKTTISRLLLEKIPHKTNVALLLNPTVTPLELLQNICQELKINMHGIKTKLNALIDKLNSYLLKSWANGENTVVIIDEAQNLPRDTLEQLRLLTNLETDKHKLLQIILIGQPELRSTMRRNDLRQLAQRVTARYHLMPLAADETYKYLQHRISIAGGNKSIITKSIANKIHKTTGGIPRLLNILTDRALLAAYSDDSSQLHAKHLKIAAAEVMPESKQSSLQFKWKFFIAFIGLLAIVAFVALGFYISKQVTNDINTFDKVDEKQKSQPFIAATNNSAWQHYFALWNVENHKTWQLAQCPETIDIGMACLRHQGNIKQVINLNHPVLLQLENHKLALLKQVKNDKFYLLNHNNEYSSVDKSWFAQHWLGSYFILWAMPAELLEQPNQQQLSIWALAMANTIEQQEVTITQLDSWIKNFQKINHLQADGIIGSETQMVLSLSAYDGPTLIQ